MAIYREKDSKTWRVVYRFTTWKGEEKQTSKRGFETKRDAQAWEREEMQKVSASLDMTPRYNDIMLDRHITVNVFSLIQKMINKDHWVDLSSIDPVECITPMDKVCDEYFDAFLSYLNYSQSHEKKVMFVGYKNCNLPSPLVFSADHEFTVDSSSELVIELSTILADYLRSDFDQDLIFPRKDACIKYTNYLNAKLSDKLSISDRIALFDILSRIVALYNGYNKDDRLSRNELFLVNR